MEKQLHLFYSGKVQGIGFRYTVKDIANKLKVYGWVKNLDDSRVEVLAEAEEEKLNNFLELVQQHFSHYISEVSVEWFPAGSPAGSKSSESCDFQVVF
ncbi:MAG: acylphosphatase [Candidatus Omnitrophica bacterium]|jgi:acylphosphatase|nr:acylphosphatase [Candidatus Omnitrophota bacterium]MDD5660993.1 acylphosphatase [Candidatus Omnitrophota bacterium]